MDKISQEDVAEAITRAGQGTAYILDVREDDEWATSHAVGAHLFSIKKMEKGQLPDVPKDIPVYTYCGSGGRAGRAAIILQNHGWEAKNLGGLRDWIKAGGTTT
ncbi:MAG: rhodanese-like domain-containing protein [Patescibacteria group bacterium]